jgi:hypothetical protein
VPSAKTLAVRAVYRKSPTGLASWKKSAHRRELGKAISMLGEKLVRDTTKNIYLRLATIINKDKEKARKVLIGGTPDAQETRVEFKFGVDLLRAHQIIFDILKKRTGKVRWLPSYDSLERTLQGNKNRSILFSSYLSYIMACDKAKNLNLVT